MMGVVDYLMVLDRLTKHPFGGMFAIHQKWDKGRSGVIIVPDWVDKEEEYKDHLQFLSVDGKIYVDKLNLFTGE
jgi:hypothetical protein